MFNKQNKYLYLYSICIILYFEIEVEMATPRGSECIARWRIEQEVKLAEKHGDYYISYELMREFVVFWDAEGFNYRPFWLVCSSIDFAFYFILAQVLP
jgi:hypothetical protein